MKKAELQALRRFKPGDAVRLKDNVLHQEYDGKEGTVEKTIKSRRLVKIVFDGEQPYYAFPENVEHIKGKEET